MEQQQAQLQAQESAWLKKQADINLERIIPYCELVLKGKKDTEIFYQRLRAEFPRLFPLLYHLYGNNYDFFYHLTQIVLTAAESFAERPKELRKLDLDREAHPHWFQSEQMMGGVCYVDLFAGDLKGMKSKIPYLKELGLTYLHLMPLFKASESNNDGGYAISDYRTVNPKLGTMKELASLATELRHEGISLALDLVFNHTSDEHEWAQKALAGEERYQDYYYIFPDRTMPDQYERTLREIFPEQAAGNFTYREDMQKWVWTSFYNFQWDLNYKNPEVFKAMLGELLYLANQGVEVIRLDAVAFIWKQLGTACENLPEAHMIIQAYNALCKIAAPALLFKSEAIVHPNDVAAYISWEEAPLSYNPTLMALLWDALATRRVKLLQLAMAKRFWLPDNCAWVNYVRVHDDIGWTFADEDAAELWMKAYDHRQFLNRFYIGEFPGSFATGLPFGVNAKTGDMRIAGTCASLAGLERALEAEDRLYMDMSLRRILLIHSVILSAGGIPLLYLGDEIATPNDYSYQNDPEKAADSRWVHRAKFDWERAEKRHEQSSFEGQVFQGLQHMIQLRKHNPVLGEGYTTFFPSGNEHVLSYIRSGKLLVLANFSEREQWIRRDDLSAYSPIDKPAHDLLTNQEVFLSQNIKLDAYDFMWLRFDD